MRIALVISILLGGCAVDDEQLTVDEQELTGRCHAKKKDGTEAFFGEYAGSGETLACCEAPRQNCVFCFGGTWNCSRVIQ